jgi:copper homeostasis protein CutC
MPGSGVTPQNIRTIRETTNANEFHAALRSMQKSRMQFRSPPFQEIGDYLNPWIDEEEVSALKRALQPS